MILVKLSKISLEDLIPPDISSDVFAFLQACPDGVTVKDVAEYAEISIDEAEAILNRLVEQGLAYTKSFGAFTLYYPVGKVLFSESRDIGQQTFKVVAFEGRDGYLLQIRELGFTEEGLKELGRINVRIENVCGLVEFIQELLEGYNLLYK